jgi:nicotinamidase-related amidase
VPAVSAGPGSRELEPLPLAGRVSDAELDEDTIVDEERQIVTRGQTISRMVATVPVAASGRIPFDHPAFDGFPLLDLDLGGEESLELDLEAIAQVDFDQMLPTAAGAGEVGEDLELDEPPPLQPRVEPAPEAEAGLPVDEAPAAPPGRRGPPPARPQAPGGGGEPGGEAPPPGRGAAPPPRGARRGGAGAPRRAAGPGRQAPVAAHGAGGGRAPGGNRHPPWRSLSARPAVAASPRSCYFPAMSGLSERWRAELRRLGRPAPAWQPARSALLVIDVQEYFASLCSGILPAIRRAVELARSAGAHVLFTQHGHRPGAGDGGMLAEWWGDDLIMEGSAAHALLEGSGRQPADPVVAKRRYSAFFGTDLDDRLRAAGIEELVLAGVMTNLCVETTAREAFVRDYRVRVLRDATATASPALHWASLLNLAYGFAWVQSLEEWAHDMQRL